MNPDVSKPEGPGTQTSIPSFRSDTLEWCRPFVTGRQREECGRACHPPTDFFVSPSGNASADSRLTLAPERSQFSRRRRRVGSAVAFDARAGEFGPGAVRPVAQVEGQVADRILNVATLFIGQGKV